MTIKEVDFELTPIKTNSELFILKLPNDKIDKFGIVTTVFEEVSYGVTIPEAIKRIASYRANNKYSQEDVTTLMEYLLAYKEIMENLINNFKQHENVGN